MLEEQHSLRGLADARLSVNQFGDHYFTCVNGGSFNQVGATVIYDDFFSKTFAEETKLFIIIGTDSGLLPQYLINKGMAESSHYLFIELRKVMQQLKACDHQLPQHEQITYCDIDNWQSVCKQEPYIYYLYQERCELIQSMAVLDGFCQPYQQFRYDIERQAQQFFWSVHIQLLGKSFVIQQIANITENQIPAKLLRYSFAGKSAIILAGGPSLDENIEWVKQHRDKFVVIAVSRISNRLQQCDVIPDILVSIDPTKKMLSVSQEMFEFPASVLLVHADHVNSQLLCAWPHRRVYLGHRYPWDVDYDKNNIPPQGPTVTNAALSLAIEMGFGRIFLLGADLCYSREGYTHAKGSAEYHAGPQLGFWGQQVECYNGEIAETDEAFFQATLALGKQAEYGKSVGCQLFNLSERATKIPGIDYQSPTAVKCDEEVIDVSLIFDSHLPKMTQAWIQQDYANCEHRLANAKRQSVACAKQIQHCRELNQKKSGANQQYLNAEKKLEKQFQSWLAVFKRYHLTFFQDFFGHMHVSLENADAVRKATEGYLSAYAQSQKAIMELILAAAQCLSSRVSEWSDKPDLTALIGYWREHHQLSRCVYWQKKHVDQLSKCSKDVQRTFDQALTEFYQSDVLKPNVVRHEGMPLDEFKKIQSKCLYLYRSQAAEALQAMLGQLSRQSSDGAKALQALCAGYLSELLDEQETAIECYYSASEHPLLRELALNHLTSVLIQCHDTDNALLTLECLCQINQGYCLTYAKLLAHTGNTESATAVLEALLAESKDDQQAKLALDQLRKTH